MPTPFVVHRSYSSSKVLFSPGKRKQTHSREEGEKRDLIGTSGKIAEIDVTATDGFYILCEEVRPFQTCTSVYYNQWIPKIRVIVRVCVHQKFFWGNAKK